MSDEKTIAVYDEKAQTYTELVAHDTPDADLQRFIDAMPAGGLALDLGCGPGNSAAMMRDAGLRVDAIDASAEMVRIARESFDIPARQGRFEEITGTDLYDGIWANFSLLHAPKSQMPAHLAALRQALKPGGLFHIGMKTGSGEFRDRIGRRYSYYTTQELRALLRDAGLHVRFQREGEEAGLSGEIAPFVILLCDG